MKALAILTLFSVIIISAQAADTLKIEQALKQLNIQLVAKANGGLGDSAIQITLTNILRRPMVLRFEPGTRFLSEKSNIQDLMIFEDDVIALAPREKRAFNFYGTCTQLSNLGPGKDDLYQLGPVADGALGEVAKIIGKYDFYNSTAQAAVWALTDNRPTNTLHNGDDVDITWELAILIAKHKSLQLPKKEQFFSNPLPFRRIVYSARKDLVYHATVSFKGTLGIYTSDGELVRRYFENKVYDSGLHFYSIGINNIVEENTRYVARLSDENGEVLVEYILNPNEAYVPAKEDFISVNFEYAIRKRGGNYSLIVYDDKDNLMEYIYKNRPLTPGYRPAKFKFIFEKSDVQFFVFKIVDSEGNEVHSQKIANNRR